MQFVIDTIQIPDKVIKLLKDRIMVSLDKVYLAENERIKKQTERIQQLNKLLKDNYEDKIFWTYYTGKIWRVI